MIKSLKVSKTRARPGTIRLASVVLFALLGTSAARAQSAEADARHYCANIARAASDARFKWQTEQLDALEARIKERSHALDAKTAMLRDWMGKREALEKRAAEKLVGIYAKMRPETAATQITMLDDDMAAAVLGQLNSRQASAIFNEIVPERAGKLAALIAGTAPTDEKKP